MNKLLLLVIGVLLMTSVSAQNPTYNQKIFYTCKVWGLVKYYHSEVSTCQVNWDSVLVANLSAIRSSITWNDFNSALDTMLLAAGPMDIAITPPPPVLPPDQRRNLNFAWTNDTNLYSDVQIILDTIINNFRPHLSCWVNYSTPSSNYGWFNFQADTLMYPFNTAITFPNEDQRTLILFKYWNIINYFNPYNYVLDVPWDSTLMNNGMLVVNATSADSLYHGIDIMSAALNDVHAEGLTYSSNVSSGYYSPLVILKYVEGKYVAAKSNISGIAKGDEITAIDGMTTAQWEDSLRPVISAGDSSVFRREMCDRMLRGQMSAPITINSIDSFGAPQTINSTHGFYMYGSWFDYHFNDTLWNKKWRSWDCGIGYVNMGNLLQSDITGMYNVMQSKDAIIFDIRNYPNGTAFGITDLMYPQPLPFAHDLVPDPSYPGTYSWYYDYQGVSNNPNAYQGQVIILVNEETQSHAEYSCMMLEQIPNAIVVGSQTAGADGNVSYFQISNDIQTGFTTLGIFYPNGDSTQRIGIVPDSLVQRTQNGIRYGRDEELEKALDILGCPSAIQNQGTQPDAIQLYPNPTSNSLTVVNADHFQHCSIEVIDAMGQVVSSVTVTSEQPSVTIDVSQLNSGIYFLQVQQDDNIKSVKFIKE